MLLTAIVASVASIQQYAASHGELVSLQTKKNPQLDYSELYRVLAEKQWAPRIPNMDYSDIKGVFSGNFGVCLNTVN